jgi:hypothetical protein
MASTDALPATRHLFFTLEDADAQGLSAAELGKLLTDSAPFLARCLASYLPPSPASKAAVDSGSVTYAGQGLPQPPLHAHSM